MFVRTRFSPPNDTLAGLDFAGPTTRRLLVMPELLPFPVAHPATTKDRTNNTQNFFTVFTPASLSMDQE
jgi:hypothetical protein